jgi:uncharacterized membrane protein
MMSTMSLSLDAIREDDRPSQRLRSVDFLRGAVMVLMVLDHTRDYFSDLRVNPTDPATTTAALFATRWVTHFCAPVFVFLAGTGAYLAGHRGKSRPELALFLLTRGLWLVVLELTVVRFGVLFNLTTGFAFGEVLWVIGWSMVVLAALIFLPTRAVGAFGAVMIATHNLADGLDPNAFGALRPLVLFLHQPGLLRPSTGWSFFILYPLIPWVGVMAVGYAFGALYQQDPGRRRAVMLALGLGMTAAFLALRAANVYGDPQPWSLQATAERTVFSFLNCNKYPPSLLYLLMTLGPAIAALSVLDGISGQGVITRPIVTLGRVPLFFFVLQWYVVHSLAMGLALLRGEPTDWLTSGALPALAPPGCQYSLPAVYLAWAVALLLLYLPCRWFAGLKARRRDAWLSYL